ncbi:MAG: EAL domain-containing protein [Acidovorax sp.]|uniref:putative bifunctional diguanylate cyclase/phosphodiesterase n=1 Tax=Acidovorax sp. TaxID=1872122 RepID=UPI0022C37710|nr:EAL domain-containing protein [Acidovorax sp.]MCZ8221180.1 EAL domain-containing protein [Acidovorax sp.]
MFKRFTHEVNLLRSGVRTMYWDTGAAAGRIRQEHLNAVTRLTPTAMVANMGNASLMLWSFRDNMTTGLWAWWAAMMALALTALTNWARFRNRQDTVASCRAVHRATLHAAILALAWGFLPVEWFGSASHGQQLVIATLFTGMMGAGTLILSSLPLASVAYVAVFTGSAIWTLAGVGDAQPIAISVLLFLYAAMVLGGAVSYWRKATALILSKNEAVRHEQMLAVVLHDFEQRATDALWEIDIAGRLRQPSERLSKIMRTEATELQKKSLKEWLDQQGQTGSSRQFAQALAKGVPFHDLALVLENQANRYHLALQGKPLFDELGQPAGWRGVVSDRTAVAQAQEQLQRQASTDSLTQLSNRFALHSAIERQLQLPTRTGALLLLDLDHFKAVNDSYGHSVGDALLTSVAHRLQEQAPAHSLVARLGGDEFAVLLPDSALGHDRSQARFMADRLVAALSRTHQIGERRLRLGCSIGIAWLDDEVHSVDELLVRADIALYDAKAHGRGRAAEYTRPLRERTLRRSQVKEGLRQAVRREELQLHWQPKIDLVTQKVTGAEALLRWKSPELGKVSPGEFIPVAEQEGLMDLIGLWALRHACECAKKQLAGLRVAVNVSPVQLADSQFVELVQSTLISTGLPAEMLELEITESIFIEDAETALGQLHELRALGIHMALDDFGTGYSSLSYLCRFPFSTLKIDRSFVEEAMARPEALAVVHHIAQLARSLEMRTVCEGVETVDQLAMVVGSGIDEAQGYLLSAPLSLEQFCAFTLDWNNRQRTPAPFGAGRESGLLPNTEAVDKPAF